MRPLAVPTLALLFFAMLCSVRAHSDHDPSSPLAIASPSHRKAAAAAPTPAASLDDSDNDDSDPSAKRSTATNDAGETIIVNVTTVIVSSGPDPNKVYHGSSDRAHQQDKGSQAGVDDPNSEDEDVARQLEQDQAALKRMVTILSVVGGVGAIAVVVTIVIFTRMRMRKRRRREREEHSLESDDHRSRRDSDSGQPSMRRRASEERRLPRSSTTSDAPAARGDDGDAEATMMMPIPSAPPAPFLPSLEPESAAAGERQRNIVSMVSHTAPAPSAPSAKELDALVDQEHRQHHHNPAHATTSSDAPAESSSSRPCPHCEPPEMPPPAYTPSAPPLYALPPEPFIIRNTSISPRRRHSQA